MSRIRNRAATVAAIAVILLAGALPVTAETGLPLPRFASLRSDKVHLRTGPGIRYPVDWVFVQRDMPVEIVAEFDNWRKVRDWQGTEGWVHRSLLSGRRTALVRGGIQPLRRDPSGESALIARVEERAVGHVIECAPAWCRIEIAKVRGWVRKDHIWGVYRDETLN